MNFLRRIPHGLAILSFTCLSLDSLMPKQARADLLAGSYAYSTVFRYDDDGAPIANGVDPGAAGLNFAAGMTIGPEGNIYVSSLGTGEILYYDGATGDPLPSPHAGGRDGLFATLANEGNEEQPVGGPGPLRFGPDGDLYVADFSGDSIRVFDGSTGTEGTPAGTIPGGKAGSIGFGPDGVVYAGDFNTASVYRFENGVPSFYVTPQSGDLVTASSLLFLQNGHLLVADLYGNKIIEYDENGQNPELFAAIPPLDNLPKLDNPYGSNFPSDLGFDQNGNILLAVLGYTNPPDNRGQLLRFDLDGNPLGEPPGTPVVNGAPTLSSVAWIKSVDAIAGDFDSDGDVDAADYNKWKADFGKWVAKGGGADGNGNGVVDAADYTIWRNNLGAGQELGLAAAVPEPATCLLAIFGILFALGARTKSVYWD